MSGKVINFYEGVLNRSANQFLCGEVKKYFSEKGDNFEVSPGYGLRKNTDIFRDKISEIIENNYIDSGNTLNELNDSYQKLQKISSTTILDIMEGYNSIQNFYNEKERKKYGEHKFYDEILGFFARGDTINGLQEYLQKGQEIGIFYTINWQEIEYVDTCLKSQKITDILGLLGQFYCERYIKINEIEYNDIFLYAAAILIDMGVYIMNIPSEVFYDVCGKNDIKIEKKKREFIEYFTQNYSIDTGELKKEYQVETDAPEPMFYEAFEQSIAFIDYNNGNSPSKKAEIDEDLQVMFNDIQDEYGISDEVKEKNYKRFSHYIFAKENPKNISRIIHALFTNIVLFIPPKNSYYTEEDIDEHTKFFERKILEDLQKMGIKNEVSAYRILKKFNFQASFQNIQKKFYREIS